MAMQMVSENNKGLGEDKRERGFVCFVYEESGRFIGQRKEVVSQLNTTSILLFHTHPLSSVTRSSRFEPIVMLHEKG